MSIVQISKSLPPTDSDDSDEPMHAKEALREILKSRAFDAFNPPVRPIPILKLGDKVLSTPGNITNIQAAAKAGKTAVIGAIIGAIMAGDKNDCDTLEFSSDNVENLAVLHFDTEQSRFDHDALVRRVLSRVEMKTPPAWFRSYCLTDLTTMSRAAVIEAAIEDAEKSGGIFVIIIDGIADLITDPNDAKEAFALVDKWHAVSIRHDCAILTVLHENPGSDGKMRGHLGSQLERKAETPLRLAKDASNGITTIWTEKARHCHIPKNDGSCFAWCDKAGMHVSQGSAREIRADAKRDQHIKEAREAFGDSSSMSYTELVAAIEQSATLQMRAAKGRVKSYLAASIISKDPAGNHSIKPHLVHGAK